jgi:hypothetical protein
MATKTRKKKTRGANKRTRAANRSGDGTNPPVQVETSDVGAHDAAKRHFIAGLISRGEAVRLHDGSLPPGATHEIVDDDDSKDDQVVIRRRFSAA